MQKDFENKINLLQNNKIHNWELHSGLFPSHKIRSDVKEQISTMIEKIQWNKKSDIKFKHDFYYLFAMYQTNLAYISRYAYEILPDQLKELPLIEIGETEHEFLLCAHFLADTDTSSKYLKCIEQLNIISRKEVKIYLLDITTKYIGWFSSQIKNHIELVFSYLVHCNLSFFKFFVLIIDLNIVPI